jgi:hypothetical protein
MLNARGQQVKDECSLSKKRTKKLLFAAGSSQEISATAAQKISCLFFSKKKTFVHPTRMATPTRIG